MEHSNQRTLTVIACVVMAAALVAMVAFGDFRPAPVAFVALAAAFGTMRKRRRC